MIAVPLAWVIVSLLIHLLKSALLFSMWSCKIERRLTGSSNHSHHLATVYPRYDFVFPVLYCPAFKTRNIYDAYTISLLKAMEPVNVNSIICLSCDSHPVLLGVVIPAVRIFSWVCKRHISKNTHL